MNTTLPNNTTESLEIKALQRGLRIAQELKNNAEAVFVQACNAVEVAEAHAADNEIVMAAIKKIHKSAQSSFLKARQKVDDFEISLKTVNLIDDDDDVELVSDCQRTMKGKMSTPKVDTNKPAAVSAPPGQKTRTAAVATNAKKVYPEAMAALNIHNSIQIADWFNEAIDKSNWAQDEQDESVLDWGKAPTAMPKEFAGIATKKIYPEAMAVQNIRDLAKDAKDWLDEAINKCNWDLEEHHESVLDGGKGPKALPTGAARIDTKTVVPEENAKVPFDWLDEEIDRALEEHDESVLDVGKVPTMREYHEAIAAQNIRNSAKDAKDWLDEELGRCISPTIVQVHDKISDIANSYSKKQTTKKRAAEGNGKKQGAKLCSKKSKKVFSGSLKPPQQTTKKRAAEGNGKKQGAKLCPKKSKKATSGSLKPPQELDGRGCSFSELTSALIEHQDSVFKLLTASAARGEHVVPYCSMFSARKATMRKLKLINSSMKIFTGKSISEIELSEKMENAESEAVKQYEEHRNRKKQQEE
eukprot:scaffold115566_cov55-Cyclotella_meneghiniana.AAC.5